MNRNLNVLLVVAIALLVFGSSPRARVVFVDTFEYAVGRSDTSANSTFTSRGWSAAKTSQTESGARGYLYTTTSIPGFTGTFPGTGSSRVLAIEALPGTLQGQTDFYLQLGNGESAAYDDYIPGDVWFQFWVYPQNYGSQISRYGTRNKFLYACNGPYPCNSHLWLMGQGSPTYNANNQFPLGDPTAGQYFWNLTSAAGPGTMSRTDNPDNGNQIGAQNTSEWMRPNRWTLVKMHMNTTSTSGNSWEVWLRPYGGAWTKVSDWVGGRTPGFTWNIPSSAVGGHRVLRMPTTIGAPTSQWYDYWMYMDDFTMATTEQDLTVYPDERLPRAPTNLRIIGSALLDGSLFLSPGSVLERLSFSEESEQNGPR
jgi:hypothetical protein